jgi:hypothetical protein
MGKEGEAMEQWVSLGSAALYVAMFFLVFYLIRWLYQYFGNYYQNKAYHLVMITCNSQHSVEWLIWSYHFWKGKKGKKGLITCIDTGSIDDTLAILQRLQTRYEQLQIISLSPNSDTEAAIQEWLQSQKQNKEKLVVMDLREVDASNESERFLA